MDYPSKLPSKNLLRIVLTLSLIVIVVIAAANAMSLLLAVDFFALRINDLSVGPAKAFLTEAKSVYPVLQMSNLIIAALSGFMVIQLQRILDFNRINSMVSRTTSIRIFAIGLSLVAIEVVGSLSEFYVFGDRISIVKIVNYAAIFCVFLVAYAVLRAAKAQSNKDIVI